MEISRLPVPLRRAIEEAGDEPIGGYAASMIEREVERAGDMGELAEGLEMLSSQLMEKAEAVRALAEATRRGESG